MTDARVSGNHESERIELLHAAGLKATFVERLRREEFAAGDGRLAAAHIERLAEERARFKQQRDQAIRDAQALEQAAKALGVSS